MNAKLKWTGAVTSLNTVPQVSQPGQEGAALGTQLGSPPSPITVSEGHGRSYKQCLILCSAPPSVHVASLPHAAILFSRLLELIVRLSKCSLDGL